MLDVAFSKLSYRTESTIPNVELNPHTMIEDMPMM